MRRSRTSVCFATTDNVSKLLLTLPEVPQFGTVANVARVVPASILKRELVGRVRLGGTLLLGGGALHLQELGIYIVDHLFAQICNPIHNTLGLLGALS